MSLREQGRALFAGVWVGGAGSRGTGRACESAAETAAVVRAGANRPGRKEAGWQGSFRKSHMH